MQSFPHHIVYSVSSCDEKSVYDMSRTTSGNKPAIKWQAKPYIYEDRTLVAMDYKSSGIILQRRKCYGKTLYKG